MTAPNSVAGFFSSGGGKGAKFPTVGTTVTGTITAVHPPENQTDFETRQPIEGKFQVRIDLATDERDPADQFDDGSRTLYTKGWLIGAIGDAVRKAGAKEPAVGGTLTVSYTGNAPASRPGINGAKQYSATYTPPVANQAPTAEFFGNTTAAPTAGDDTPPTGIDAAAWAAMPADAKAAVRASLAGTAAPF
jgi:hypothetical protein